MPRPGDRLDQFELVRPLGHGAYAETWVARDGGSGEQVVLKLPSPQLLTDPKTAARFQREAAIARRLQHPSIQSTARSLPPRGSPYIALQFVEGESLRERLDEHGAASVAESIEIVLQIARALAYAHDRGVVHRDLKPENVLLQPDGTITIIDFGSALLEGARRLTWRGRGEAAGTPDYMAPEQIEGRRGDARTDIYALGVIFYELLTGRVPFEGDNANAVMYQHVHTEPLRPGALRPDLAPALEAVVLRALAKRPEARYQHAADLLADLERLEHSPDRSRAAADAPAALVWRQRLANRLKHRSGT